MSKGSSAQSISAMDGGDKFLTRLPSRDRHSHPSMQAESSFRVLYYGVARGAVPFVWESQPGTPKHPLSDHPPPPLTPPPYYSQSSPRAPRKLAARGGSSGILSSILPKIPSKKISNASPSPSSSSSSFSSSYSLPSTPVRRRKNNITSINSHYNTDNYHLYHNNNNHNDEDNDGKDRSRSTGRLRSTESEFEMGRKHSPRSTLCFGPGSLSPSMRRIKGCYYPIKSVKKVVLSMVGQGKD